MTTRVFARVIEEYPRACRVVAPIHDRNLPSVQVSFVLYIRIWRHCDCTNHKKVDRDHILPEHSQIFETKSLQFLESKAIKLELLLETTLLQLQWHPANGHLRLFNAALEWLVTCAERPKSSRTIEVNVPNGAGYSPTPLYKAGDCELVRNRASSINTCRNA
jgi:hypothetical protein